MAFTKECIGLVQQQWCNAAATTVGTRCKIYCIVRNTRYAYFAVRPHRTFLEHRQRRRRIYNNNKIHNDWWIPRILRIRLKHILYIGNTYIICIRKKTERTHLLLSQRVETTIGIIFWKSPSINIFNGISIKSFCRYILCTEIIRIYNVYVS